MDISLLVFLSYMKIWRCISVHIEFKEVLLIFKVSRKEIKFAGRNINNLRFADNTTLMAQSEEELTSKSLLMKMKEESEKSWLKTQHAEN